MLSPRQVKKNKRAAEHQAALAAVAASRSASSKADGAPPSVPSDGAPTTTPAPGDPLAAETGGDTDAMSVDVSSPAVDPAPQHKGAAATGAPRARKRTEAVLASPPPIAQARHGGPGPSPVQPCVVGTMGGPSTAVYVPLLPPLPPPPTPTTPPLPTGRYRAVDVVICAHAAADCCAETRAPSPPSRCSQPEAGPSASG